MIPIFQRLTNDEERNVIYQAETITELANGLNLDISTVSRGIHRSEKSTTGRCTYQVVWIDDDDEEENEDDLEAD